MHTQCALGRCPNIYVRLDRLPLMNQKLLKFQGLCGLKIVISGNIFVYLYESFNLILDVFKVIMVPFNSRWIRLFLIMICFDKDGEENILIIFKSICSKIIAKVSYFNI